MNALTTLKTLALPVAVVLLTHSTGAFAAESLANGIRRRVPQGITIRLYACANKAPDNADAIGACLSVEKAAQTKRLDRTYRTLLGTLDGKANGVLVSSEQAWQDFHTRTTAFEIVIYGKSKLDNLQHLENEIFRLSERTNALDKYLAAEGH